MAGQNILLVEKEEGLLRVMTLMMKQAGYRVTMAQDGTEAYNMIMAQQSTADQIDLLITDLQVRDEDDRELISRLSENNVSLPIIAITDFADARIYGELSDLGCTSLINKPLDPETLMGSISNIFNDNPNQ